MQTITLEIPDEVISLARLNRNQISKEALKLLVLELFREELVSLGKAAELSRTSINEFMEFAASRKVPLHYGTMELVEDRKQMDRLKK